ncbi:MAG: ribosome maturation factor RimP [Endomicrobiaceae bacterium]|jgi:ribosome maturation factor RimP|nr:ribosome maturation factor RimP [Endomicrobiaceae bacterium]MDD4166423.1 ribosome maturation factor RimP [Endomicrobiaceae bacterium]
MNLINQIEEILTPEAAKEVIEIVDIEFVKENGQKILRIFIDNENGINLDDCTKMSHIFGVKLDEADIIKEEYVLEVSSPGIDRILKKEKDFLRFKGFKIKVATAAAINNQRHFSGRLAAAADNKIVMDDLTNGIVEIEISNIIRAKVDPEI